MFDAVIFDMDGLLVDSEPFWKLAERRVFGDLGIEITDEMALTTETMTTRAVTNFWFDHQPWPGRSLDDVELDVVGRVAHLVQAQASAMIGADHILCFFEKTKIPMAIATNSPRFLANVVVKKLGITDRIGAVACSDDVEKGKPDPSVYLAACETLGVRPNCCLAFEDSATGLAAAQAAGMTTVVVPPTESDESDVARLNTADIMISSLLDFSDKHLETIRVGKRHSSFRT